MESESWSWETFIDAFPTVLEGLGITFGLTIACYLLALVFGFFWTWIARIPIAPIRWVFAIIKQFIRSTPPLVQLFFLYYAWPVLPVVGVTLDPFVSAMIGLGIHYSTYVGEVYRSGIDSVATGQWEASRALNFSTRQKWTKIILPQAIPPTIPMLGNYLIIMFKEVPLASTVGVAGILFMANDYGSHYFKFLEPITIVAILFLVLSYPSSILIKKLEKKMNTRFDKKAVVNTKMQENKGAV